MPEDAAWRVAPRLVVVWRVTTRCQLTCAFCAYARDHLASPGDLGESLADQIGSMLAAARARSGGEVHVSFLGGEPLGWEPLARVARRLAGLGLTLGLTTNGAALGAPLVRGLLTSLFAEVTVSVDGLAASHDRLRGWRGGFERLQTHLRGLAAAKRATGRGPLLRVNSVLMRDNIDEFPALCRELAAWGVEEVTFNRLGGRDRPDFFVEHHLLPLQVERFAAALPALRGELASQGLVLKGGADYLAHLLSAEKGEPKPVSDCMPGERFLFIDERGMIAPCSFTLDSLGQSWPGEEGSPTLVTLGRKLSGQRQTNRPHACDDCQSTQLAGKFRRGDGS